MEGKAFAVNFQAVGTLDDAPYLCVKAALGWRKRISWKGQEGEAAVMGYLHHLAVNGGSKAAEILGTEALDNEARTLTRCALSNVRLPLPKDFQITAGNLEAMIMKAMMEEHSIAVVVLSYRGHWWVRFSAKVYLTIEDFETTALRLRQMCEDLMKDRNIRRN